MERVELSALYAQLEGLTGEERFAKSCEIAEQIAQRVKEGK